VVRRRLVKIVVALRRNRTETFYSSGAATPHQITQATTRPKQLLVVTNGPDLIDLLPPHRCDHSWSMSRRQRVVSVQSDYVRLL